MSLVVRGGAAFTPTAETRLRELDQLLVVATAKARAAAEERIRAVDQHGKLARWNVSRPGGGTRRPSGPPWPPSRAGPAGMMEGDRARASRAARPPGPAPRSGCSP